MKIVQFLWDFGSLSFVRSIDRAQNTKDIEMHTNH